jgi:hypothetical protein
MATPTPLDTTTEACESVSRSIQQLTDRRTELNRKPGGRFMLSDEEKVEFDLIGGVLADVRAHLARVA